MNFLKNSLTVSFITLISRITGYIRDVFFANFLGTSLNSDVFIFALKIPIYIKTILFENAFTSVLIPQIMINNSKSLDKKSFFLISNLLNIFLLIFFPVFIIFEIFMPQLLHLIAPGFFEFHNTDLFIQVARIMFPYIFFIIINAFFIAILNSGFKFAIAAGIQIIINLTFIISLWLAYLFNLSYLIAASYAVVLGAILQTFILYMQIKKKYKLYFNFKINLNKKTTFFFKKFLSSILIHGVVTINQFIGFTFATFFVSSVSYLHYADRIYQLPFSIISVSIAVVLLPNITKFIKENNFKKALFIQQSSYVYVIYFILPSSFFLFFFSDLIVSTLLERGQFNEISTIHTSISLKGFAIGLPAFSLISILLPYFFVINKLNTLIKISLFIVLFNFLSVYFFQLYFDFKGISYALSVSSWCFVFLIYYHMVNLGFNFYSKTLLILTLKYFIFSIVLLANLFLLSNFLNNYNLNDHMVLFIIILCGTSIYLALTYLLDKEMRNRFIKIFNSNKKIKIQS